MMIDSFVCTASGMPVPVARIGTSQPRTNLLQGAPRRRHELDPYVMSFANSVVRGRDVVEIGFCLGADHSSSRSPVRG
jgi:hypothetical protein